MGTKSSAWQYKVPGVLMMNGHSILSKLSHLSYGGLLGILGGVGAREAAHLLQSSLLQQGVSVSTDWVGYGVGGAIAIIVIQWKRSDDAKHATEIAQYAKALEAVNLRLDSILENNLKVITANTAAFVSMEVAFQNFGQYRQIMERINELEGGKRKEGDG